MNIGPFDLNKKVLLIAEIGNNHEGDFDVAKTLVQKAAECGVAAVKFQTYRTEQFVAPSETERYKRAKSFELRYEQFEQLSKLAHSLGLLFLSTPLDLESAKALVPMVDALKIASGDTTFYPLLEKVAASGKPVLLSTGLSTTEQIQKAVGVIKETWSKNKIDGKLAILHCVTSYPVPPEQANLLSVKYLADQFGGVVGYSDHTLGIDAACLAVALGARIVEKHFTLDKHYSSFHDHAVSADPPEMRLLVEHLQQTERMLGHYDKTPQACEAAVLTLARRSIVAGRDLAKGHRLQATDLTWIRPAKGLPPGKENELVGKCLKDDVRFGDILSAGNCE